MFSSKSFSSQVWVSDLFFFGFFGFFFVFVFRAAPASYGSSQARGQIGVTAAGLYLSHSNMGSEPHRQPIPQLKAVLDP